MSFIQHTYLLHYPPGTTHGQDNRRIAEILLTSVPFAINSVEERLNYLNRMLPEQEIPLWRIEILLDPPVSDQEPPG